MKQMRFSPLKRRVILWRLRHRSIRSIAMRAVRNSALTRSAFGERMECSILSAGNGRKTEDGGKPSPALTASKAFMSGSSD